MITVTKIDGTKTMVNADLIEMVDSIPETMLTLTTGRKIYVKETPEQIVLLVVDFRRRLLSFEEKGDS